MSGDLHRRARDVFARVRRLPDQERGEFLDEQCAGDEALRDEVESLLRFDSRDGFLETPALGSSDGGALASLVEDRPDRIGAYRVIDVLGEGGMGVVYLAEQASPARRVALKVIRAGASERVARLFERESELLARLNHPNVAQVYESGTDEQGRAFIAMELVEGTPLNEYVREAGLDRRAIVELLAGVCEGVQHAHQKGVIHRDLKPANVLVDGQGRARIVDFGIARDLEGDQTVLTSDGSAPGTLRYMSPEQLEGEPSDARSDVYALGVLSYELLAGRHPVADDASDLANVVESIRKIDPPALATLDRSLRGDLATIVSVAMEKEPQRRYQSAAEMAGDLRRYLADEPIGARPPSVTDQFRRLARRRPALVAGGAIGLGALVLIAVVSATAFIVTLGAVRQREAALADADREAAKAGQVLEFLTTMLRSADPSVGGADPRVADVLEAAERDLATSFEGLPLAEADARAAIGRAYGAIGRMETGETHLRRAIELREQHLGASHADTLGGRLALADLMLARRDSEGALREGEAVLALATDAETRAAAHNVMGLALVTAGDPARAETHHREALELMLAASGEDRSGVYLGTLARALRAQGRLDESLVLFERADTALRSEYPPHHADVLSTMNNHAIVLAELGRSDEAVEKYEELLAIRREVFGPTHPDTLVVLNNLANELSKARRFELAEPYLVDAYEGFASIHGAEHVATLTAAGNLAACYQQMGRLEDALPLCRRVYAGQLALHGESHLRTLTAMQNLARVLTRLGEHDESIALYERLVQLSPGVVGEGHWVHAAFRLGYGMALTESGRMEEAEAEILAARAQLVGTLGADHPHAVRSGEAAADLYTRWGRPNEAAEYERDAGG